MLDQRLRRWPTLIQHLVSVPCWLGKSQHKAHMREMVNYFLIDVPQVYIGFI